MRITKITAHAGTTFNDPVEQFCNHRPGVTLEAELEEGEDHTTAALLLQAQADAMVRQRRHTIEDDRRKQVEHRNALDRLQYTYGQLTEAWNYNRDIEAGRFDDLDVDADDEEDVADAKQEARKQIADARLDYDQALERCRACGADVPGRLLVPDGQMTLPLDGRKGA